MKNEIARREIESLDYYLQNHTNDYSEESHTAMMMAIKALEHESILDKIRAEIEEQIKRDYAFAKTEDVKIPVHCGTANGLQVAIKIIDKYKESEEV